MRPKDIRLGNYIQWDDDSKEIIQVESIERGEEETKNMYFVNGGWIEDFLPVPISEDWLIKFGFTKDKTDNYFYGHPTYKTFYPIYKRGESFGFNGLGLSVKEFKYIHQLQNLYYSLTSEELTIKELSK